MKVWSGVGIGSGVAFGPVLRMIEDRGDPAETPSSLSPSMELSRAQAALAAVTARFRDKAAVATGQTSEILGTLAAISSDPAIIEETTKQLETGVSAERAVHVAFFTFASRIGARGGLFGERAADVVDLGRRVRAQLEGREPPGIPDSETPFVLVARDLSPADTSELDLDKVLALVTSEGGPTSHTAILAREKGITAVVGASGAAHLDTGDIVIVDAANSSVVSDPGERELAETRERRKRIASVATVAVGPCELTDGRRVEVLANLGTADDAQRALDLGADGVGLFRTEFLFLSADTMPTVADQEREYRRLLEQFDGRKVVVRVLDAGADKPLAFIDRQQEDNPALGLRGIRALRVHEELLRTQLEALSGAQSHTRADLWVMAPMISTPVEAAYFKEIAREHDLRTAGVMIEVPAAAIRIESILAEVDFVSIGTNDLTQYTMAADRLLSSVAGLASPWEPAVLSLISKVCRAGSAMGKPTEVCGEAAADPLLAAVLVGMGIGSLSMAPPALIDVTATLQALDSATTRSMAAVALKSASAAQARTAVQAIWESSDEQAGSSARMR